VPATHILLLTITTLSILLMLARPRHIPEVWWVGTGAALLILLRLIPLSLAGHAIAEGTDVYLFLLGMMLLSALARDTGVFDWLSSTAIRHARGSRTRLFLLIYAIGTAVTVCMSNDATAVVLTPAVLAAVHRAKVKPLPYLFACAMIANAASFVLPISNPANLVVFRQGLPSLTHWLRAFALPSLASIAATYIVLRLYFRKDLAGTIEHHTTPVPLKPEGKLVLTGLALVIATLLTCSAFSLDLGLPTCLAALAITAASCLQRRANPWPLAKEISWITLLLVAALFILVDAVESIGALHFTSHLLAYVQHLAPATGATLTAFTIAVANNLVNNLPLGLLAGATLHTTHTAQGLLANATLIGVDLGPNLSITGSLATILWLLALRKHNIRITAWQFLKCGLLTMPIALIAALTALLATSPR
jgi:arsenical pump membrane protein